MKRSHQYKNSLVAHPASNANISQIRSRNLHEALSRPLDRVNVLGDDSHGHTGCVNALSWARDGELLLSGGDDTTVRVWAMDSSDTSQDYPFKCRSVIRTGHRANIFSAHMLPFSSRMYVQPFKQVSGDSLSVSVALHDYRATVAGDKQARVFDIGEDGLSGSPNGGETIYTSRQSCIHVLRCHNDRVKRIVTEHSPDLFLTVSEDGSVRQYDLRTPHECRSGQCPPPLLQTRHDLSTATLSPLTPHLLVVAGEAPYGYLYDRRNIGRSLADEWGIKPKPGERDALTHCVRRFGRPKARKNNSFRADHITGARMSDSNGHEVILNYSADAVYLFSTTDDPQTNDSMASSTSSRLSPNPPAGKGNLSNKRKSPSPSTDGGDTFMNVDEEMLLEAELHGEIEETLAHIIAEADEDDPDEREEDDEPLEEEEDLDEEEEVDESKFQPDIPIIPPRHRYAGARNVATVKDVNFLGPNDEFVTSGSDDGNFFIWNKADGSLQGIYEGDGSVVNMVEGHPTLPLIAVSGIDYTVKLFAPGTGPSPFARMDKATQIVESNARMSRAGVGIRYSFASLIAEARQAMAVGDEIPDCRAQ